MDYGTQIEDILGFDFIRSSGLGILSKELNIPYRDKLSGLPKHLQHHTAARLRIADLPHNGPLY
jgi:hypothetical protein